MKQFSRELQAAHAFESAARNFRQALGCECESALLECYDHFVSAVSGFMLCELHMRQAERCRTAGIQRARAGDLGALALDLNAMSLASLRLALDRLQAAGEEAETARAFGRAQRAELNSRVDEFGRGFTIFVVEEEIKPSDLGEILGELKPISQNARKGPAPILSRLRADVEQLIELRERPDRGAATNIPGWKLGGIAIILGVMYVYYVRCIRQQNCTNSQKAFLLGAGGRFPSHRCVRIASVLAAPLVGGVKDNPVHLEQLDPREPPRRPVDGHPSRKSVHTQVADQRSLETHLG